MNTKEILEKILEKIDLDEGISEEVADSIINGEQSEIVTSAILVALRAKGESEQEILGFAKSMRKHMIKVDFPQGIDTAGTGGDFMHTINVSTASAILLSLRVPVLKHGNRSVSSKTGSADFLERLGYNIYLSPEQVKSAVIKSNFAFLFAQLYHPAMKNVANVRKTLGVRTIFNLLGPLTNPASVERQVIGVFSINYARKMAEALHKLRTTKSAVVFGEPGIDEVSLSGLTHVILVEKDIDEIRLSPEDFGVRNRVSIEKLQASSTEESVEKVIRAFLGLDRDVLDFIAVNSSVAYYVAGVVKDFKDGYELAINDTSEVITKVNEVIKASGGDVSPFLKVLEKVKK
ncbi:anthranilate phosphoribosyltransferase [Sulfolobales archaeon HS-7]|nr:anthranilate phosphoribosyltransferase [Sulfolobales archaeon HS-7]